MYVIDILRQLLLFIDCLSSKLDFYIQNLKHLSRVYIMGNIISIKIKLIISPSNWSISIWFVTRVDQTKPDFRI